MQSIKDNRGYNQIWRDSKSTRIRAERRCDRMISQMNISQMNVDATRRVLEIGCGTGQNSFMLAQKTGMNVLGTDLCVQFIDEAKKNFQLPNLRYDILDFNTAVDMKGETFDYIVGNGILHHLYHHLSSALTNMHRLLKDNGKIIFLEPNIYNPYIYMIFSYDSLRTKAHLEPDEMAFSKSFVAAKLSGAGYKNIEVEYRDFLLPGIPEIFIRPSIVAGSVLEKVPLMKMMSQSLLISALK